MVCLGIEPGAAGWKVTTKPLSYGSTPRIKLFILSCYKKKRHISVCKTRTINLIDYPSYFKKDIMGQWWCHCWQSCRFTQRFESSQWTTTLLNLNFLLIDTEWKHKSLKWKEAVFNLKTKIFFCSLTLTMMPSRLGILSLVVHNETNDASITDKT